MSKKKIDHERLARAALRQRVRDIACGAAGANFDKEDEFATATFLERFVPALQATFLCEEEGKKNAYLFETHNLSNFENIDTSTEFLWEHGVRAK